MNTQFSLSAFTTLALLSATPAVSEEALEISFRSANEYETKIVQELYGANSGNFSVAAVDLEADKKLELFVRFDDYCTNSNCYTVALFQGEDRWHQIFDAKTDAVFLQNNGPNALKSIVTPDGVEWAFEKSNFVGHQLNVADIRSVSNEEPMGKLPAGAIALRDVMDSEDYSTFSLDLGKDGTFETIVALYDFKYCSAEGFCDAHLFNADGSYAGPISTYDSTISLYLDPELNKLVVNHANGYVTYAYSQQRVTLAGMVFPKSFK